MKDDEMQRKHERAEMKGEMKHQHHTSEKGMDKPHMKKSGGGLIDVTLEGSGRGAYPKPKKLNDMCY